MKNAIVSLRLTLDIPKGVIENLVGPDDGSNAYYERACDEIADAVMDDSARFLDYVVNADVDVDG